MTFTDLAYADPIRIMVKTGFSLRPIIQWMDHAMLAIYAVDHKQKLAANAICCSLDAKEFATCTSFFATTGRRSTPCCVRWNRVPRSRPLAKQTGVRAVLLREIFMRVAVDPHVLFLDRMWYTGYGGRDKRPEPPVCTSHTSH